MNDIVVGLVIGFVLNQLEKAQHGVNWTQVKAQLDKKVADVVPGTWFDVEAEDLANKIVDAAAKALADQADLKVVLTAIAKQDWVTALSALKAMIANVLASQGQLGVAKLVSPGHTKK